MNPHINSRSAGRSVGELGRRIVVGVLGTIVVTAGVLSFLEKPAAGAGAAPVIVTNTPLPVGGTLAAQQSGPWSVAIANAISQPVPVRNVDAASKTPFETTLCSPAGDANCPTFHSDQSVSAPADKLLVVEYVSGSCFSTPAGGRVFDITLESSAGLLQHAVVPVLVRDDNFGTQRTFAQQTRLYVPPHNRLTLFATETGGTHSVCTASLSGYLQSCIDEQCRIR